MPKENTADLIARAEAAEVLVVQLQQDMNARAAAEAQAMDHRDFYKAELATCEDRLRDAEKRYQAMLDQVSNMREEMLKESERRLKAEQELYALKVIKSTTAAEVTP